MNALLLRCGRPAERTEGGIKKNNADRNGVANEDRDEAAPRPVCSAMFVQGDCDEAAKNQN